MIAITIPFVSRTINAFTLFSFIGVAFALIQSAILLNYFSLNWWLLPIMFVTSSLAFLIVAMLIKVVIGKEDHVMLRYFIVIVLVNYFIVRWLNLPVLPYLDILVLGYGTIILFGRFGCFVVGCCHGRPSSFGVCYTHDHVRGGFSDYYSGVRLFPVQLVEALGLLSIISALITILLSDVPGGTIVTIFIALYGLLRFILEFFRGDPARPYFLSFSEAQWTVFLLVVALLVTGWIEILPVADWQMIVNGFLVASFFMIGISRFIRPQFRINEPWHIKELMKLKLGELTQPVKVHTTSLGLNISGSKTNEETQYTFSASKFKLDNFAVKQLTRILSIRHPGFSSEIRSNQPGVFHVIFRSYSRYGNRTRTSLIC